MKQQKEGLPVKLKGFVKSWIGTTSLPRLIMMNAPYLFVFYIADKEPGCSGIALGKI